MQTTAATIISTAHGIPPRSTNAIAMIANGMPTSTRVNRSERLRFGGGAGGRRRGGRCDDEARGWRVADISGPPPLAPPEPAPAGRELVQRSFEHITGEVGPQLLAEDKLRVR